MLQLSSQAKEAASVDAPKKDFIRIDMMRGANATPATRSEAIRILL